LLSKTFRLVASAALLAVCTWSQTSISRPGASTASFDERLGEDDGAALAILFGANLRGNLDLCD
jgi:hypothetical protein